MKMIIFYLLLMMVTYGILKCNHSIPYSKTKIFLNGQVRIKNVNNINKTRYVYNNKSIF